MKTLIAILTLAGAAAFMPGCAGTVDYGYGYDSRPFYSPGYYTYNYEHPTRRPFESYHFHPLIRHPVIRPHVVVRHNEHGNVRHDGFHREANVR